MAIEIKMPQLSDTMSAGKILVWRKNEGDEVKRGDILAEVETDKANLEIESFQQGKLLKILTPAQSSAKVGEVIAVIGAAGESVTTNSATTAQPAPSAAPATAVAPTNGSLFAPASASYSPASSSGAESNRIKASPLARKIAEQHNVDLSVIKGSGPQGRIIKKDVEAAESAPPTRSAAPAPHAQARVETPPRDGRLIPLSRMREVIARRMQESVTQAPHFYVTTAVNMQEVLKLREVLKEKAEYKGISVNHFVIKAAAYALRNEPRVNNTMREGQLFEPGQINIGIITAVEEGLLIPIIKEADQLALKDLVFEARAAIERARAGRPSPNDLVGGTFSISNMGMFDVENFTAIINPGQGAVLAVSSVHEQPIVARGQIVIGHIMKATLSVDHRIIDGVMAAQFLKFFKEGLEIPALLMT